jgi:hypothetical protein
MKNLNCFIFALLAFLSIHSLKAEIFDAFRMNDIYKHLQPEMLVIFDIDNTLIEPVQELGTNQWFENRIKEYISYGCSKQDALEKALREWNAIQNVTLVKLVEPDIACIMKDLQNKGCTVMGLTTRGLGISTCTLHQLQTVNIDLEMTAPTDQEIFFMNGKGVLFRGGILFTAGTHKGDALEKFLKAIDYKPSSIMFINDKLSHLLPVEEYCGKFAIPFAGIRYGFLDEKVKNFRKQIAEIQFYHFGHILSNEAAERILHEPYPKR